MSEIVLDRIEPQRHALRASRRGNDEVAQHRAPIQDLGARPRLRRDGDLDDGAAWPISPNRCTLIRSPLAGDPASIDPPSRRSPSSVSARSPRAVPSRQTSAHGREHGVKHRRRQHAGIRIVARTMITIEQDDVRALEGMARAVGERKSRRAQVERAQHAVVGDPPQGDDRLEARQGCGSRRKDRAGTRRFPRASACSPGERIAPR